MKPTRNNLIVRLESYKTNEGKILLPDSAKEENNSGEVVAVGLDIKEIKVGDKVFFNPLKIISSIVMPKNRDMKHVIINENDILVHF